MYCDLAVSPVRQLANYDKSRLPWPDVGCPMPALVSGPMVASGALVGEHDMIEFLHTQAGWLLPAVLAVSITATFVLLRNLWRERKGKWQG